MTKKQISLLILLVFLFVLCLGTAIYFFLNPKDSLINVLKTDRYQELVDWCDTNTEENKLDISCNALLLEIRIIDTNNSCAEVQVITKEKKLKDISICGDGSVITYSNEVLDYKKLMPINIDLTYTRKDIVSEYKSNSVKVSKLDETYIQGVINEDFAALINTPIDRELKERTIESGETYLEANEDTYTITNSVDYCPKPQMLPDYISNKLEYYKFYEKNILSEASYSNLAEDKLFGEIFGKVFACDSSSKIGYSTCNLSKITRFPKIPTDVIVLNTDKMVWGSSVDLMSRIYLKQISAIYDNMYASKKIDTQYTIDLNQLISDINTKKELNEATFCSAYKLFDSLTSQDSQFEVNKDFIKSSIVDNIDKVTTQQCLGIFSELEIDLQGTYLKVYFSNLSNKTIFRIYNQCNNLSNIIN